MFPELLLVISTEALLPLWAYGGLRPTMWILGIEQAYMVTEPLRGPSVRVFPHYRER